MAPVKKSKTTLFLMELILVILIFAIASAICMQLFSKSSTLTKDANELDSSSLTCANVMEIIKSDNGSTNILENEYITYDNNQSIYFNEEFDNCKKDKATYHLVITTTNNQNLNDYMIKVIKDKKTIYSQDYQLAIKH